MTDKPVSATEWQSLAAKRIFFGHQSVGFNILTGVEDLLRESHGAKLKIVEIKGQEIPHGPALIHARLGENGNPESKCDAFVKIMDTLEPGVDIAMMKFCYVDITARTDVTAVFHYYEKTINKLKKKYPSTLFVHVTVPLTTVQEGLKASIKKLFHWPVYGYADDIKRNLFNEMLKKEYEGKEPIFDLALAESTDGRGNKCTFSTGGRTYLCLRPDYSTDGGHLNERGRDFVARQFIGILASQ